MSAGDWLLVITGVTQLGLGFLMGRYHEQTNNVGRCPKREWHES